MLPPFHSCLVVLLSAIGLLCLSLAFLLSLRSSTLPFSSLSNGCLVKIQGIWAQGQAQV